MVSTSLGRDDEKVRMEGFGSFHQLDCLRRLKKVVRKETWEMAEDAEDEYGGWEQCFDYLRQMVLCNADGTVKTSRLNDAKWLIEGFKNERQCRDATWLYNVTA